MNLRIAKKITKNAETLNYSKTQISKAATVLRRKAVTNAKNAAKAAK
jgi:hypothetical protein